MLKYEVMMSNQMWRMKEAVKQGVKDFLVKEDGDTYFISIVIVLVIVIALAVMFRDNIQKIVSSMWKNISDSLGGSVPGIETNPETF